MLVASLLNLTLPTLLAPSIFSVVGPMVVYTTGIAMALPALTILALDCFPERRGMASAMQGFIQAIVNALVTSLAIPLLHDQLLFFILGQGGFFLLAVLFLLFSTRKRAQMLAREALQAA